MVPYTIHSCFDETIANVFSFVVYLSDAKCLDYIYMLLLCATRYLTFVCFADFQSDFDEFAMFLMHVMIATFVCLLKRIGKEVVKQ